MIEISHIARTYTRTDGTPVVALKDVSVTIGQGEFVTIRGASGSGKSSLLNIIGCLDTPTSGTYKLEGEDVSGYTDKQRSQIAKDVTVIAISGAPTMGPGGIQNGDGFVQVDESIWCRRVL